jgi:hypothetical protein
MKKPSLLRKLLPSAVLFALLLAGINPAVVFAEGEAPETAPEETPPTETLLVKNGIQDAVQQLADAQAAIIAPSGSSIPLVSQTALDALTDPDPWFYCSVGCVGGRSPVFTSINAALAEWAARKGTGMIYLESGFNQSENVILSGTTPGLNTLKGIVWDTRTPGEKPVLSGAIAVENMLYGFKLDGINITSTIDFAIAMQNNAGAIVLNNLVISNTSGEGIYIANHKGTISLNQITSSNHGSGAYLNNCNWNGSACTYTASVSVTNSKFTGNGKNGVTLGDGVTVISKGTITVGGVTALGNNGSGLNISSFGTTVTIKNSVFSNNIYDASQDALGNGIVINPLGVANITLDNVYLLNNQKQGAFISTLGNVALKNLVVSGNGQEGILITKDFATDGNGAKNVTVQNSTFKNNTENNFDIYASGSVIITNLTSTGSVNGSGLLINNVGALTPLPVTLSKVVLNGNGNMGSNISSKGTITVNNINASQNNGIGLYLDNDYENATGSIIILGTLGTNQVNNNGGGLIIDSTRNITVSSLQANNNSIDGIYIEGGGPSSNIILTGIESSGNQCLGIYNPVATGTVTVNKVTAYGNGFGGIFIDNSSATTAKSVLVSNSVLRDSSDAGAYGLTIYSVGQISLNNITTSGNNAYGAYLDNSSYNLTQIPQAVTIINSQFDNSINDFGIVIYSQRKITLTNISASGNAGVGIIADNTTSTIASPIVMTGANRISNNVSNGILFSSKGAVTASGIIALGNSINEITTSSLATIANSQFSGSGLTGLSIKSNGNTVLRGVNAIQNGINNGSSSGIAVNLKSGRLYIYSSVIMANSGFGLYASVVNPSTDVYLAPTNIIFGNDVKDPYTEGEIQIVNN